VAPGAAYNHDVLCPPVQDDLLGVAHDELGAAAQDGLWAAAQDGLWVAAQDGLWVAAQGVLGAALASFAEYDPWTALSSLPVCRRRVAFVQTSDRQPAQ